MGIGMHMAREDVAGLGLDLGRVVRAGCRIGGAVPIKVPMSPPLIASMAWKLHAIEQMRS